MKQFIIGLLLGLLLTAALAGARAIQTVKCSMDCDMSPFCEPDHLYMCDMDCSIRCTVF